MRRPRNEGRQARLYSQSLTKSPERKREQRKRWFRNGQKWRTGSEGRISVVKRRHGLARCRYKGYVGMNRWVGLGVIADNVVNLGRAIEKHASLATAATSCFLVAPVIPARFALYRPVDYNVATRQFCAGK